MGIFNVAGGAFTDIIQFRRGTQCFIDIFLRFYFQPFIFLHQPCDFVSDRVFAAICLLLRPGYCLVFGNFGFCFYRSSFLNLCGILSVTCLLFFFNHIYQPVICLLKR